MQQLTSILEFQDVTIRTGSFQTTAVSGVSFSLLRGEIALVRVEEGREHSPLASLAQGLLTPGSGKVFFNGECWDEASPGRQSVMRSRTRRVFEHYGWVTNLDMMENICLAECYHTDRSMEDIQQEVRSLARRFGLEQIPDARPTRVHPLILRKLEWVRALVGTPELIILERPFLGAPKADRGLLVDAVCEAARQGVAVLWLSDDRPVFEGRKVALLKNFRMEGDTMLAEEINKGTCI